MPHSTWDFGDPAGLDSTLLELVAFFGFLRLVNILNITIKKSPSYHSRVQTEGSFSSGSPIPGIGKGIKTRFADRLFTPRVLRFRDVK